MFSETSLYKATSLKFIFYVILPFHTKGDDLTSMDEASNLHSACSLGDYKKVQDLLENGADVNVRDDDGNTPMVSACFKGHVCIVELLLKCNRIKLDLCNYDGTTPLHAACLKGHKNIIQLLLDNGVSVDARDEKGNSALFYACQDGNV